MSERSELEDGSYVIFFKLFVMSKREVSERFQASKDDLVRSEFREIIQQRLETESQG